MTKGAKTGADDLLAAAGDADLGALPRAEDVAAEPLCTRVGDDLQLTWPGADVEIAVTALREHHEGISGELWVRLGGRHLHMSRLGLASAVARAHLVKELARRHKALPWGTLIEQACVTAVQTIRTGSPVVCLMPLAASEARYRVSKVALAGETNVIFGDGGTGKSLLAMCLAVAAASGRALAGGMTPSEAAPVLYLDYESCIEEHQDRLRLILAGLGITTAPPILYRAMTRPLAEEAASLRAECAQHGVNAVILDSLAPACGAEPEGADAAIRTMNALRAFGPRVTRLVLAHVSKAAAEQRTGPAKPFGSVFVQNLGRNVWELRRTAEDDDDLRVALYHRKVNRGRLLAPIALRVAFSADTVTLHSADLADAPDLLARTSLTRQILLALRGGAKKGGQLAEALGQKPETIGRALRRLAKGGHVVRLSDEHGSRGQEIPWGLPTSKADT